VANTLAYYDIATITAVISFIVQAAEFCPQLWKFGFISTIFCEPPKKFKEKII
jgi:hypothetical protein